MEPSASSNGHCGSEATAAAAAAPAVLVTNTTRRDELAAADPSGSGAAAAAAAVTGPGPAVSTFLQLPPRRPAPSRCTSTDNPTLSFPAVPEESASVSEGQLSRKHTQVEPDGAPGVGIRSSAAHGCTGVAGVTGAVTAADIGSSGLVAAAAKGAKGRIHRVPGLLGRFLSYTVDAANRSRTAAARALASPTQLRGNPGAAVGATVEVLEEEDDDQLGGSAPAADQRLPRGAAWRTNQYAAKGHDYDEHVVQRSAQSCAIASAPSHQPFRAQERRRDGVGAANTPSQGSVSHLASAAAAGSKGGSGAIEEGPVLRTLNSSRSSLTSYLSLSPETFRNAGGGGGEGGFNSGV
ncbi:hypothetical protein Vretifemale_17121, partial [Volvox reticuliferus]